MYDNWIFFITCKEKTVMKKLISIAIVLMSILPLYSQENFKWDIVTEVPGLSKNELYSITKMFIAKTWKSANNVIQNDDKDAGQILVRVIK